MSASDSNIKPDSVPPPEALAAGQRMLAAIVFTDTVGFSKLMSKEEERALRLVGRDLDHMKAVCGAFGGQVLKSTGDGLLMLFTSAVQAVACALEIQRDFQKQNLELPKTERLQHRIGIHLGDVFQNGGDVMGDGVNIAARLQAEAVPGGICLSQTVYDVVNNRLPFYVNDLGARTLKNIGRVNAYQISPVDSERTRFRLSWYRWRSLLSGMARWALLPLIVLVFWLGMHREWAKSHPGQPGAFTLLPLPAASPIQASTPSPGPASAPPAAPASSSPASPASAGVTGVQEASETEFQDASFRYMTKYDFDGMEAWMREHDWPGKSTDPLANVCPQLNHLVTWSHQQLQSYSLAKPLKVVAPLKTFYYWPAPFGGIGMKSTLNGVPLDATIKPVLLSGEQIKPGLMVGIAHTLIKEHASPDDALTIQLYHELHLFVQTYHVVGAARKPAQGENVSPEPAQVETPPHP